MPPKNQGSAPSSPDRSEATDRASVPAAAVAIQLSASLTFPGNLSIRNCYRGALGPDETTTTVQAGPPDVPLCVG